MAYKLSNPYRSTFKATDFAAADVTMVANQYVEYGRYTVKAGQGVALGYGALAGQDSATGRIYAKFIDDTFGDVTVEEGMVRIEIRNPQDRPVKTIFEARTEALRTMVAAPSSDQLIPLPMMADVVTEDFSIVILFKADAADTIQFDFTKMSIDYTNFDCNG
jgi:hypothetical protein